jgi:TM2 domain-containing membrane protein YozV
MDTTPPPPMQSNVTSQRVLCGVMGLILGFLGIHRFILGDVLGGILRIVIFVAGFFCCGMGELIGWLIGFIEGIIYLTKSDEEFIRIYQVGKKGWF